MTHYFGLGVLAILGTAVGVSVYLFYKGLFYEFEKREEKRRKGHAEWRKARGITQRSDNQRPPSEKPT